MEYEINEDGLLTFTKESISIDTNIFKRNSKIKKIIIPKNIVTIRDAAFCECLNLNEVIFEDGHAWIDLGVNLFENCKKLKQVKLSNRINTLSLGMFGYCKNLEEIEIPKSVTYINIWTFYQCTSLNKIKFHNEKTQFPNTIYSPIFGYTLFEGLFNILNKPDFIKFVNNMDSVEYIMQNFIITNKLNIKDVEYLVDFSNYNGFKNGLNFGI